MTDHLDADVLFSARQWEFAVDQIRLSAITNAHFFRFLRSTFEFERVEMEHVPSLDGGANRASWPPGIVCEFGFFPLDEQQSLAVRKLGIGPTRVVIEVGGTSDHAQIVCDSLREMLDGVTTPAGAPVLGEPRSQSDFSVIAFTIPNPALPTLIQPGLASALASIFKLDALNIGPSVTFRHVPDAQSVDTGRFLWEIKPRFETELKDGRIESRAQLSSSEHLAMIERIFQGSSD
jgi:hypothetical protein